MTQADKSRETHEGGGVPWPVHEIKQQAAELLSRVGAVGPKMYGGMMLQ